ncbi:PDT-domain-containing protein [Fistulina hepatica ATCC 64428]|uniref:prephenate dehydratase n=1 Tax=Fistulina hepatica ATCC 64428 TaxID=1128425 RepID=A0A0D7A8J3_9AGAR|nr:PDT-domain-containing protein [Fistulina hepatica ATCC 64428]
MSEVTSLKVAFLGPIGTYSHEQIPVDVLSALSSDGPLSADVAVIPHENSLFGTVAETYDALMHMSGPRIVETLTLSVQHCLLARKENASMDLSGVTSVLSHEQALGQCGKFITTYLPNATLRKTSSTAAAALSILSESGPFVAIGSHLCAEVFVGLQVLQKGIQDNSTNLTRFYIIARPDTLVPNQPSSQPHGALLFLSSSADDQNTSQVRQTSDLGRWFAIFTSRHLNPVRIDRRPSLEGGPFHDSYFIELEEDVDATQANGAGWRERIQKAVAMLSAKATVKLLGIW